MSKTPEEMAEDWILDNRVDMLPHPCKSAFLAGYKAAQQWISVKDRLPEEGVGWTTVYGCILSRWSVQPGFYDRESKEWVSRFIGGYMDDEGYAPFESVTHWMPLPEPPKEEK